MPTLHHLSARATSLLLMSGADALPRPIHWGAALGEVGEDDLDDLLAATAQPVPHSSFDEPAPLELLPQGARGHAGRGVLAGHRAGHAWSALFADATVTADPDPLPAAGSAGTVRVRAVDPAAELALESEIELSPTGLLRLRHRLTNTAESGDYDLASLPVQLLLPDRATEVLDLSGRWSKERVPQRHPLAYGAWVREERRGRTGHDAPTLLVVGEPGFGFSHGEVWAVHVAWSGDTSSWAERLPEARAALGGGELLHPGEVRLGPGASYTTPWVCFAHSTTGLDGLSAVLHDTVRSRPTHPTTPRPVVLNTWEAVYFDHDLERLTLLAERAAEVGVERFVLDDGWFGGRRSDRAGLGDWTVSAEVWPDGLTPLVERVRDLGMDFGLWVEPEMVNLDSDLAREHPDWLLASPLRLPPSWRYQHVLDLAHPEAFAHLLGLLDRLLADHDIAFLKWDHNRDLVDAHHEGRPGVHAQTTAFYALLDELRARHPGVEIESCASGGGRVDLEVLARTDRVWTSDCTDARERQQIQRWTGLLVPPELVGAHVSAPVNHQTGRTWDLGFRAGTALFGHLGIEWDLTRASAEERAELARWVACHRALRPLLHGGRTVRAEASDGGQLHGVVSPDQEEAVYALVQLDTADASVPARTRLPGLDPRRRYTVAPLPPGDRPRTMEIAPPRWLAAGGVTLPGSVLAEVGLACPVLCPGQLLLLRATAE